MLYIPGDIFVESIREVRTTRNTREHQVLVIYTECLQTEGTEPDASRIDDELETSLETVQIHLNNLAKKGWLARVREYSE